MPIVDDNWIRFNPEHAPYKGRPLIHHHVDGQNMTVLIPDKMHYDKYSQLHAYLKDKVKGPLRGSTVGKLGTVLNVAGFMAMLNYKNPDSWVNSFGASGDPEDNIGKVLKDPNTPQGGLYLVIEKVTTVFEDIKNAKGEIVEKRLKSRTVEGTWYSDYIKDAESGQYKGINKNGDAKETWNYDDKGNRTINQTNVNDLL